MKASLASPLSAEACEQLHSFQLNFASLNDDIVSRFPDTLFADSQLIFVSSVKHAARKAPVLMKAKFKEDPDKLMDKQVIAPLIQK